MKKYFFKAALLVAAVSTLCTSCDKDGDKNPAPFTSDLIGSYTPLITTEPDAAAPLGDLFITPTWVGDEPTVDMSFMAEGASWPVSMVLMMSSSIYTGLYGGGLVSFDFKNDGSFGFKYRELVDLANLEFSQQIYTFPDAETQKLIPEGALGYYTENSKVYFKVAKAFISQMGQGSLGTDLVPIIDGMIESNGLGGSIVSTEEYYALPLKYTKKDGKLTILIDREMIMPFIPLIKTLASTMVPESAEMDIFGTGEPMTIPARALLLSLVEGLFEKSASVEIGVRMAY